MFRKNSWNNPSSLKNIKTLAQLSAKIVLVRLLDFLKDLLLFGVVKLFKIRLYFSKIAKRICIQMKLKSNNFGLLLKTLFWYESHFIIWMDFDN